MSSEAGESDHKNGGFGDKIKSFIGEIGEKIEEAVGLKKPTADVVGIHIPHIDLETAEFVVDVLIHNPTAIPIPLVDIDYAIESDGRKLVSGVIPDAGTIHAHGSETVKIPVQIVYADIKNTYEDIKPGSVIPYKVLVVLRIDVPVIGRFSLPLEKSGEIPVPYKPEVDVEKIKFDKISLEEANATLHMRLVNKNDFKMGLKALNYEMWLADESIASAELSHSAEIGKQGETRIHLPLSFRPKDFGSAVLEIITRRKTGYSIKGNIDVDTPFGNMNLPISKKGDTRLHKGRGEEDDEE